MPSKYREYMNQLNATSSSQPYMTLNTSYTTEGEKEVSFDPRTVSWEDLSKLYADDDMLRTLFSMMQEWSKSAPEGYVFKLDPSWFSSSTWKGSGSFFTSTSNPRSTSFVLGDGTSTTGDGSASTSDSGSLSADPSLRYQSGDLVRLIGDVTLESVSITAPAASSLSGTVTFKKDER